ncbi:MAG: hypothetical protein WKF96_17135 [Solirubrobacteraceae bacterium]
MTSVASSTVPPWMARLPRVLLIITVLFVAATVPLSLGNEPIIDTVFFGLIALDLDTLTTGLRSVIADTKQPAHVTLWAPTPPGDR